MAIYGGTCYPITKKGFITWNKSIPDTYYLIIPNHPRYMINKRGEVLDTEYGHTLITDTNAGGYPTVKIVEQNGRISNRVISRLLVHTFYPIPHENFSEFTIYYQDGNKLNYHYNNVSRHTAILQFAYTKGSEFRYVTGNQNYIINHKGVIVGLSSGKEVSHQLTDTGYLRVGLHNTDGTKSMHFVHRLLGFAFLPKPRRLRKVSFTALTINHKDGNTTNNYIDLDDLDNSNLEWMTLKENINHAHDTGLAEFDIPIRVRDVANNKVTYYRSVKEAADAIDISRGAIMSVLNSNSTRALDNKYQFKHRGDTSRWRKPCRYVKISTTDVPVKVKDTVTGIVTNYTSVADAARELEVDPHAVHGRLASPDPTLIHARYAVKLAGDNSTWAKRYIEYKVKEPITEVDQKVIKVLDITTGVISYYDSAVEASTALGLDIQGVRKRVAGVGIVKHLMNKKYLIKSSGDTTDWPTIEHAIVGGKKMGVYAVHPDGAEHHFPTVTAMAAAYGVNQSTMTRRVSGTVSYDHDGVVFKKAA